MLNEICNKLKEFGVQAMGDTYDRQERDPQEVLKSFNERLWEMITTEDERRIRTRSARLIKQSGINGANISLENFLSNDERGISKETLNELTNLDWKNVRRNLIITGPTGTGKTWIAKTIGMSACKKCIKTSFKRCIQMLEEIRLSRANGTYLKKLNSIIDHKIIILDDFGTIDMSTEQKGDLLELIDCLREKGSVIITSQRTPAEWYDYLCNKDPLLTEAILDRLLSDSTKIQLCGNSLRRQS